MNNFNFSQEQLNRLLGVAGKKMGIDPENLKTQMESGKLDGILQGLSGDQRDKISGLMNDPAAMQQLISDPKVLQLLKGLMGK